jgi:hypothetical protein
MALAISVIRSEPSGILCSNSMVAWIFHLLSRSRRSTSPIGVSPAPNGVCAVIVLPIFQMYMGHPVVMLLDERDRRNIVAGHEMSDIHVRAVIFCKG